MSKDTGRTGWDGWTRRSFLKSVGGAGVLALAARAGVFAATGPSAQIRKKPIPKTGELLPVVGLGTARTFDAGRSEAERAPLREVLRLFVERQGTLVDSSPMYGEAERIVGDLAAELGVAPSLFLATKVWTRGRKRGIRQMEESMRLMRSRRIDLIQVHNLRDWRTQLKTLREWKEARKIRYLGVTHYVTGTFDEIGEIIRREKLDFIEIPYSIENRAAEARLLPTAHDHGTAVIAHTPYAQGGLFRAVRGRSLPDWAAEFDCQSWGQFFLKYLISHPAVICPIPATTKPRHLLDNMGAGYGRLPDEATRRRMVQWMEGI